MLNSAGNTSPMAASCRTNRVRKRSSTSTTVKTPVAAANRISQGESRLPMTKKPRTMPNSTDPQLKGDLPPSFIQHKQPKVAVHDLAPAEWPQDRELEWCPPGHGDLYVALVTSGTLDKMLDAGYEYAFISNADNLGAVLDFSILGYFIEENLPFLMEVANRTTADRKGGHLARLKNGQLVLRELAQCPEDDIDAFQNMPGRPPVPRWGQDADHR